MHSVARGELNNTVYCYFSSYQEEHHDDNVAMIRHWRRSWGKNGWNAIVLTEADAKSHPFYHEVTRALFRLPTTNHHLYELACYHRWLAVAHRGGGWMCDYDVVNYGFKPIPIQSDLTIWESHDNRDDVVPSLVSGTMAGFLHAAMAFALVDVNEVIGIGHGVAQHTSDMLVLQKMAQRDFFNISPTVIQYGHPGWENAHLIHYSHSTTENTDRVECMKTARPL